MNDEAEALLHELSPWLSAALGDDQVCDEYKDICERVLKHIWNNENDEPESNIPSQMYFPFRNE